VRSWVGLGVTRGGSDVQLGPAWPLGRGPLSSVAGDQRGSPQSSISWGARWTPPRSQVPSNVIKRAHPTSNSAGPSVGSLAHPGPAGHPTAGRCCRVACRASTPRAPLYSPCASSAFGWGLKPPSRSALAPVESPPGLALWPVSALKFSRFAPLTQLRPNPRPIGCDYSQPAHASPNLISSPTKSREVTE
jgi:hypothetical protein